MASFKCPHCKKTIPFSLIATAAAKRIGRFGGRPKAKKTCPKCGGEFGTRELRAHIPQCSSHTAGHIDCPACELNKQSTVTAVTTPRRKKI